MKSIHLIVVGKLKDKNLESLESDYLKRVKNPSLQIHEVKSCEERLEEEALEVIKKIDSIGKGHIVLLAEKGRQFDSPSFSSWLYSNLENHSNVFFVIGGASGHGQPIQERANECISLGQLTYPHKIARLLFVEQIYRAMTINDGHPYHK
ncbi:MAG: 23S rRNA (pseudouridine1915-N3)-methyltransferase [Bacteriovoracaceae bacterium]|jgi:23S rRNA (pseudouridine1915-N3)-methyltransferase